MCFILKTFSCDLLIIGGTERIFRFHEKFILRRVIKLWYFIIIMFLSAGCVGNHGNDAQQTVLYVSSEAMKEGTGSPDAPFRSVSEARDKIRMLKVKNSQQDFMVMIHGGLYHLDQPVVFTNEDAAVEGHTITYKAVEGEYPVFSSGVPVTGWIKSNQDPPFLPEASKGNLWEAKFPEGVKSFTVMFDDSGRLPRAIGPEFKPVLPRTDPRVENKKTLFFPKGSLRNYENMTDVEIWIVPTFQWSHNILPLSSVDIKNGIAKTSVAGTYPLAQRERGYDPSRFRVCNVPDALDQPGEWFMDSNLKKIWLWSRDGTEPKGVVIPVLNELLAVMGDPASGKPVSGLIFDGLTFKHAKCDKISDEDIGLQHEWEFWDKPNAMVRFRWTKNCILRNCLLTESGSGGIRMDLYAQNNSVENCEISNLGGTGIALIGDKFGNEFVNRGNTIYNNHIHRIGLEHLQNAAVFIWQSGENNITHNRIHHTPYNGFSVGGVTPGHLSKQSRKFGSRELGRAINFAALPFSEMEPITRPMILPYLYSRDNIFSYNDIYRNMEVLGDGNPFYIRMSGDGNILRHNYFHDVYGSHSAGVMRFDGNQSGTVFEENVIYRCTGAGINFHKANRIVNNILVDIQANIQIAFGGKKNAWRDDDLTGANIETTTGPFFICQFGPGGDTIGIPDYDKSEIRNNVMVQLSDEFSPFYGDQYRWKGRTERYTDFTRIKNTDNNLLWTPYQVNALRDWMSVMRQNGLDLNSIIADPMFVDAVNQDFRFKAESPALKMGIKSIDRREAGLLMNSFPAWLADRVVDDESKSLSIEGL